jgi:drug/metabolite transporter (DMT)-like permease
VGPLNAALLLVCVLGISAGQLMFKLSARSIAGAGPGEMWRLAASPWFLGALATYGGATVLWVWLLRELPLNRAYPYFALSFLFVPLLGGYLLGEPTQARYWVGIALIVAGIWIAGA